MLTLQLFGSFFMIGLFAFGGGYAMVPLIKAEILGHGWLSLAEFTDIIAISQMTPGPIAINLATFVGHRVAGLWGATVATLGVVLPSFILALIVTKFLLGHRDQPIVEGIFRGVRPAVVGLIGAAGVLLIPSSILTLTDAVLGMATVILVLKTRISPVLLIMLGGLYGLIAGIV